MTAADIFARYAYPPNELGYCGPANSGEVLSCGLAGLEATARCFEGTWPYFEFIATRHGLDPLDGRVVESYWLGGALTEGLDVKVEGADLLEELARAGGTWAHSTEDLLPGMTPDHNFHVFAIYPWLGLLSRNLSDQPRLVLDRCRIRWGELIAIDGDTATVASAAIEWDGERLSLGPSRNEAVVLAKGPIRLAGEVSPGDVVALHWNWICGAISQEQLAHLRRSTATHLDIANQRLELGLVD
ncbi:MAG: DUF6390 family protein [Acidimicrobiia bacterium]